MIGIWLASFGPLALAQDGPRDPPELSAKDEERGRELYDNGVSLYNEGRYEQAVLAWQAGYDLTKRPGFLYNISNAYERLGKYDEALDTLAVYRAFAKTSEREVIERRITSLEQRRNELKTVETASSSTPSAAGIDRKAQGRKNGAVPGITLATVGVLAVGSGVWLGQRSRTASGEVEQLCDERPDGAWLCPAGAQASLRDARNFALGSDIAMIGGGALAVTGFILTLASRNKSDRVVATLRPNDGFVSVGYTWTVN